MKFDNGRWHDVALRVTSSSIEAWIDDECVVEVERGERRFTVYDQLRVTRPVGVFTWKTEGALKDIGVIRVGAAE